MGSAPSGSTELSARRGVTGDEKGRTCWADVVWITGPQPIPAELALHEHRDHPLTHSSLATEHAATF
jgi:hypothetical protein